MRVLVLDTSAFIGGFDPLTISEELFTVPEVRNELISDSMSWMRFNAAIERGKLAVKNPAKSILCEVNNASKKVGDIRYLSEADLQVLALALELKNEGLTPLIVTDDYSIQNVANKIGIDFTSLMTFGIKYHFKWVIYCPGCYHKYPPDYKFKTCEICGTELKRKPKKKTRL